MKKEIAIFIFWASLLAMPELKISQETSNILLIYTNDFRKLKVYSIPECGNPKSVSNSVTVNLFIPFIHCTFVLIIYGISGLLQI